MAKPIAGFGRRAGNGTMSNADLRAMMQATENFTLPTGITRHNGGIPMLDITCDDGDDLNVQVHGPSVCYMSINGHDAVLDGPRIRALVAFLQEHFPDA